MIRAWLVAVVDLTCATHLKRLWHSQSNITQEQEIVVRPPGEVLSSGHDNYVPSGVGAVGLVQNPPPVRVLFNQDEFLIPADSDDRLLNNGVKSWLVELQVAAQRSTKRVSTDNGDWGSFEDGLEVLTRATTHKSGGDAKGCHENSREYHGLCPLATRCTRYGGIEARQSYQFASDMATRRWTMLTKRELRGDCFGALALTREERC